jgi:uncharacterized protein YkwD
LRISHVSARSYSLEGEEGSQETPNPRRTVAMIIGALVLLAAFVVTAPYLSSVLKQGSSIFSGITTTGPGSQTSTVGPVATTTTSGVQCSSVVSVRALANPDIKNGSADIAYPPDYCVLASYALAQINADRAANGTGPVALDYNQAAQQHTDSMLYHGYFSHFDPQGYKPYMRYTLLGGRAADFENVAFYESTFPTTSSVEDAIKTLEHLMVYNDSACCGNGHRDNILDPFRNRVSIGIAYSSTYMYFDEEFENNYINLNFSVTSASASNPYYVTMTGVPTHPVAAPSAIYIAYDSVPTAETITQLNDAPREYGPGTLEGGVLPRSDFLGGCAQFTSGITVCADTWKFTSTSIDIAFSLEEFVKNYGPGVYTLYLVTGTSTDTALTTVSLFVP